MTGILPIRKYITDSALNNFREYSMVAPGAMAPFFGFTKEEVQELAGRHQMDFSDLKKWYDGYQIGEQLHTSACTTRVWRTTYFVCRLASAERECFVPNMEVGEELKNAVTYTGWAKVAKALDQSRYLLRATLDGDADTVVRMVETVHEENASIVKYTPAAVRYVNCPFCGRRKIPQSFGGLRIFLYLCPL